MPAPGEAAAAFRRLRAPARLDRDPRAAVTLFVPGAGYSQRPCYSALHTLTSFSQLDQKRPVVGTVFTPTLGSSVAGEALTVGSLSPTFSEPDRRESSWIRDVLLWEAARETQSKHQCIEISRTLKDLGGRTRKWFKLGLPENSGHIVNASMKQA